MASNEQTFHNIVEYAEKNHMSTCPCSFKPEDFQNHVPDYSKHNKNFLLI